MENTTFLITFILEAGAINKFVLLLLSFMSVYSWGIILTKFFQYSAVLQQVGNFKNFLSSKRTVSQLVQITNNKGKIYLPLLTACLSSFLDFNKRAKKISEDEILSFDRVANIQILNVKGKYKKGLSPLAIISSSAPFIGLFGTVIGIITTFSEIALQKSTSLAVIAPGVAEALVATGYGIFVAIPALIFYNHFTEKLRTLLEDFEILSMRILNILKLSE